VLFVISQDLGLVDPDIAKVYFSTRSRSKAPSGGALVALPRSPGGMAATASLARYSFFSSSLRVMPRSWAASSRIISSANRS
jgi:hypothetical protein